jgi:hypothetical protein
MTLSTDAQILIFFFPPPGAGIHQISYETFTIIIWLSVPYHKSDQDF